MKKFPVLLVLLLSWYLAPCQSDKEIRKNKVKSITVWQSEKDDGSSATLKESYEVFDKNGNVTLQVKYKKDGSIDSKGIFKYDKNQNKTEELEYDAKNQVVNHKMFVYNTFQKKTEEKEFSSTGELLKKTTFTFTPSGEKASETIYDSKGVLQKKIEYKYNPRSLKLQKTTINKAKQVESTKKWTYEYY